MASLAIPIYVYKILPEAPPSIIPDVLPLSDLDRKDGFIHLSDAHQVPITADLFFGTQNTIWLLKVRTYVPLNSGGEFRWAEGLPGCVHLHAAKEGEWESLGNINIEGVEKGERKDGEKWVDALQKLAEQGWLVD